MMLAGFLFLLLVTGFLFLLLVTDGSTYNYSEDLQPKEHRNNVRVLAVDRSTIYPNCSHRAVINFLDLKEDNAKALSRPGGDKSPTVVTIDVKLFSILDVNEKEQQFVSYLWVDSWWYDEDMTWNSSDFCGIKTIYPSTKVVWMPDLTIAEMTDTKDVVSPYFRLYRDGGVFLRSNMVIFSNCPMDVYMFPFDVQKCNLTFKSIIHPNQHLVLGMYLYGSIQNTKWSLKNMAESEWLFVNMTVSGATVNNLFIYQSVLVYTITMKRRSALYIANFLLPILFFLCLDLTSFLIPDNGGEKLGFKVTVLLAVTVMQLILNDILPSSSNRIPLIAIYCIGVFGLMMLSLLETILMMYLMAKDSASQDNEAETDQSLSEDCEDKVGKANCCTKLKKWTPCASVSKASVDETPSEQLSVTTEGNSSKPTMESIALEKISDELKEVEKTLTLCDSRMKEKKLGYWAKVAKIFNLVFFICYVIAVIAFLTVLFLQWNEDDEK